jgi:hypothetical protein
MKDSEKILKYDILKNPEKYAEYISIKKIVADSKVYSEGVKKYENRIRNGDDIGTIIVIKHPKKELYAVLDGHHRYWAQKEMGIKEIKCAVIQDYFGLLFSVTKEGLLQPTKEFTKYLRVPFKKIENYLYEFLHST